MLWRIISRWIYDLEYLLRNKLSKFWFILISSLKIYFKWHDVKKEEICDSMEKIWIKKEFYILSYEFLKFMSFFWFLFDF